VIWSKDVVGLGKIYVEDVLLPKAGYRETRQYLVKVNDRKGVKGVCKVNPLGQPESEYESGAVPPVVVIVCENAVPAVSVVRAAPLAGLVIVKTVGVVGGLMVRE